MRSTLVAVFLALATGNALAQPSSPGLRYLDKLQDAFEELGPVLDDKAIRSKLAAEVKAREKQILEELKWAAQDGDFIRGGYLTRIRTQYDPITRRTVALEGVQFLGVGPDPQTALIASARHGTLEPVGSDWLQQGATYLWITARPGLFWTYSLQYGPIADSGPLNQLEVALKADREFASGLELANRRWIIDGALANLRRQSASNDSMLRAAQSLEEYRQREERIEKYTRQLDKQLAEAAAAQQVQTTLATLGSVLSLATLSLQVKAALPNMSSAAIDLAGSPAELSSKVKEHEQTVQKGAATLRSELDVMRSEQTSYRPKVIKVLDEVEYPPSLRGQILLK